ncbi:MAG: peptidoglycan editing factor PgeF [Alphaproteobacteria bacterium]|nr:peptidoglycan editing factor PgeF [Alphaproteobacteria bacterium]
MLVQEQPLPITSDLLTDACSGSTIRHGFFTRAGGVSGGLYRGLNVGLGSGDDREDINENRKRVCRSFAAAPDRLATPHQIHSPDVWLVDQSFDGARPKADAVVSATPGIVLGVLTADCGPVLLADAKAGIIGAAHAGWSGALSGVVENTVDRMVEIGAARERITACLGPSISAANYEVGPEFVFRFIEDDPSNDRFFSPSGKNQHCLFDLQSYTLKRLARAGISAHLSGHCTYADEDKFFSYRRATHRNEPDYGRQISAISIVDGG